MIPLNSVILSRVDYDAFLIDQYKSDEKEAALIDRIKKLEDNLSTIQALYKEDGKALTHFIMWILGGQKNKVELGQVLTQIGIYNNSPECIAKLVFDHKSILIKKLDGNSKEV